MTIPTPSAEFQVNSTDVSGAMVVTAGAAFTLSLKSNYGVASVVWRVVGNSSSLLTNPTLTSSGVPLGETATGTMPSGENQGYLVEAQINGGVDDNGQEVSAYTFRALIGVLDEFGNFPYVFGEQYERSSTHGIVEKLNEVQTFAAQLANNSPFERTPRLDYDESSFSLDVLEKAGYSSDLKPEVFTETVAASAGTFVKNIAVPSGYTATIVVGVSTYDGTTDDGYFGKALVKNVAGTVSAVKALDPGSDDFTSGDYTLAASFATSNFATLTFTNNHGSLKVGMTMVLIVTYQKRAVPFWSLADITTDSDELDVSGEVTTPIAFDVSADGKDIDVTDVTSDVTFRYHSDTPWDDASNYTLVSGMSVDWPNDHGIASPLTVRWSRSRQYVYVSENSSTIIKQFRATIPGDLRTLVDTGWELDIDPEGTQPSDFQWDESETTLWVLDGSDDYFYQYTATSPGRLDATSYASKSFNYTIDTPFRFYVNPEGTKVFVANGASDPIRQLNFGTPGDISTLTNPSISLAISSEVTTCNGVYFEPDGSKVWLLASNDDAIHQFSAGW